MASNARLLMTVGFERALEGLLFRCFMSGYFSDNLQLRIKNPARYALSG
jgi:hypothetical protein